MIIFLKNNAHFGETWTPKLIVIFWRKLSLRLASDSKKQKCAYTQCSFKFPIPLPIPSKFSEKRMSYSPIHIPWGFEVMTIAEFENFQTSWVLFKHLRWRKEERKGVRCLWWSHVFRASARVWSLPGDLLPSPHRRRSAIFRVLFQQTNKIKKKWMAEGAGAGLMQQSGQDLASWKCFSYIYCARGRKYWLCCTYQVHNVEEVILLEVDRFAGGQHR